MRGHDVVESIVADAPGDPVPAQHRDTDPGQLLARLQALSRDECLRTLRPEATIPVPAQVPGVTGGDRAGCDGRSGLRALFEDAAAGLGQGDREVIELKLRRGLGPGEVAAVLRVSRRRAHTLLSRAVGRLEACLGVLSVGRASRGECGRLGLLLAGWDGQLTARLRTRVHRHIEHCATCGARRDQELHRGLLLGLSPGAALSAGAAESSRCAPGVPAGLRARTLALATGHDPGAAANRAAVLGRAGAFGPQGFPEPLRAARRNRVRRRGP
jgi:hypothetical protein